jgi:type I restriction enzyme, S subunit
MASAPSTPKAGWEVKTLGEVCRFIDYRGKTPKKTEAGLRLITAKNVRMGFLKKEPEEFVSPASYENWMTRGIPKVGDVLFTTEAPLGLVCQLDTDEKVIFAQRIITLQPDRILTDSTFLKFALMSPLLQSRILEQATGATAQGIKSSLLKKIPVPVPPLPEQERIVGILDEAFEGIAAATAQAEENLHNARELFQSVLQSTLLEKKWEWQTIGDLCEKVEYGTSAKSKKDGQVPVLRMGNIQEGRFDWDNLVYSDDPDEIQKYLLRNNDVLFNRTNSPELVGKTAIYRNEMPAIFAGYLIRIHRKEELLDADYLNYFLNSQIAIDYGKTVMTSSVNQANINGTKLKEYPLPVPSLSEQQAIVEKLDALSEETKALEAIYERKQSALAELKQSLLQKAFAGEL